MKHLILVIVSISILIVLYTCNDVDEDICECYVDIENIRYKQILKEENNNCADAFIYSLNKSGVDVSDLTKVYCKKLYTKE
jgi:hypothetical protein